MRKSRKRIPWFPYVLFVLAAVLLVLIAANVLESGKIRGNSEELKKEIQSLRKAAEELEKTENMEAENKKADHAETGAELQEEEGVETEKEDQDEEAAVKNREEVVENDGEDHLAQEGNGRKIALDPGHQGPG